MKKVCYLSLMLLLFLSLTASGQSSKDELRGDWELGSSWVGEVAPGTIDLQNVNINIHGYITRNGNLSFKNNATLTVEAYDTLVVGGDLLFENNTYLTIKEGGVMVVTGNFTSNNNIDVDASGSLVVLGDFTSGNNTDISVTGDGAVYVVGTVTSGSNTTGSSNVGDQSDLEANTSLADFINQVAPGVLPINLLYFTAIAQTQTIEINWAASKAWDFSHYELQRSRNGKDFEWVATIDAEENTDYTTEFSYADRQPHSGTSYYRLKAVDIDGKYEYKGMEVVQFIGKNFEVYPNPVTNGSFKVNALQATESARLILRDQTGRIVRSHSMSGQEESISTQGLPAGLYILLIQTSQQTTQSQLLIQ